VLYRYPPGCLFLANQEERIDHTCECLDHNFLWFQTRQLGLKCCSGKRSELICPMQPCFVADV
jgi:hypothetical protein